MFLFQKSRLEVTAIDIFWVNVFYFTYIQLFYYLSEKSIHFFIPSQFNLILTFTKFLKFARFCLPN